MVDGSHVLTEPTMKDLMPPDAASTGYLTDLTAQATLKYSMKDYTAAAELYSHATELQAKINGEMSPQNADLLYAYGRCLYHVAVKISDVLGIKVAGEKSSEVSKKSLCKKRATKSGPDNGEAKIVAAERNATVGEEGDRLVKSPKDEEMGSKPYFQFTGDETFDTSDEEADDEERQEGDDNADEEDDFANAYEVLDLARVLLLKKIEKIEVEIGKGKSNKESPDLREVQERLADTYDLQAEISLEGERFADAVLDLMSALDLKKGLFPQESSLIAEAHYKLSLALEFSSVTQQRHQNGEPSEEKEGYVDYAMREKAVREMEASIESCKLRIRKEQARLQDAMQSTETNAALKTAKENIDDVGGMILEMEQRLSDLRQPPVSINDPKGYVTNQGSSQLTGILGSIHGKLPEAQKVGLEQAARGVNDITRFVKRQKRAGDEPLKVPAMDAPRISGKRKVDVLEGDKALANGKKPKIEDVSEQ